MNNPQTINKQKVFIRNKVKKLWQKLRKTDVIKFSHQAVDRFYKSKPFIDSEVIAFYLPGENEVNIKPAIDFALFLGKRVVMPVTESNGEMAFKEIETLAFETKKQGSFSEPIIEGKPFPPSKIDLFVVPIVAFSASGYGVGSDSNFYERFFSNSKLNSDHVKVAFAFSVQKFEFRPDENDHPIDEIYTEIGVIRDEYVDDSAFEIPVLTFADGSTSEYKITTNKIFSNETSTIDILLKEAKMAEEIKTEEIKLEGEDDTVEFELADETMDIPTLGGDDPIDETSEAEVDIHTEAIKPMEDSEMDSTIELATLDLDEVKQNDKMQKQLLKDRKKAVKEAKKNSGSDMETNEIKIDDSKLLSELARKGKQKVISETHEVTIDEKKAEKLKAKKRIQEEKQRLKDEKKARMDAKKKEQASKKKVKVKKPSKKGKQENPIDDLFE